MSQGLHSFLNQSLLTSELIDIRADLNDYRQQFLYRSDAGLFTNFSLLTDVIEPFAGGLFRILHSTPSGVGR